jgi:Cu-Zn family superoxide dismutase
MASKRIASNLIEGELHMRLALAGLTALALASPAFAKDKDKLVVPIKTSTGQDAGTATFHESKKGELSIKLELKNLPFGEHAVHIHAKPVCDAPDFKGAGPHFNPDSKQHGTMNPMGHHNGDLPQNISIGEDHTGSATFKVDYLSMTEGSPNNDMKTDPTGNAGNRIACGVITAPLAQ